MKRSRVMKMETQNEAGFSTGDIALTESVAALAYIAERQADLIHRLTAPRPSQLTELLHVMPLIVEALQALFAPTVARAAETPSAAPSADEAAQTNFDVEAKK